MNPEDLSFKMRIISSHKSAFERQIKEAVLIIKYSGITLMNSKTEYNRCSVPRISIKMSNKETVEDTNVVTEKRAIEEIKKKYPNNKKRTARECESIKRNLVKMDKTGKMDKKRIKLDEIEGANKFTTDSGRIESQLTSNVV